MNNDKEDNYLAIIWTKFVLNVGQWCGGETVDDVDRKRETLCGDILSLQSRG